MYEELIQKLNPKPKFELKWYKNEDLYSDGSTEDINIDIIANNEPEEYVEAIAGNFCWPVYYHLTHTRKNILNWYPFDSNASVLEIGCGLGAITSVLCDKCKDVTAVELSKRRATATLLRCREKENLEIIVGNLNDIEFEKKFDYITLIGVLEYQGSYTDTNNPYVDFLKKIKTLLKPNGRLLIAIENQYGLKYWCGAREDHTAVPFEGMNQYAISGNKIRTFSKATLDKMIKESGLKKTFFYYPMPDYKLPKTIYSEAHVPHNSNMLNTEYYYIPDTKTLIADEKKIYSDVIDNNVFEFFANSFLVECTEEGEVGEVTFASISGERFADRRIGTRFTREGKVEKFPLEGEKGKPHMMQVLRIEEEFAKRGVLVLRSSLKGNVLVSDYLETPILEDIVLKAYRDKDTKKIFEIFDKVYADILKSSECASWEENIIYTLGLEIEPDSEKYGPILKTGYLDMILRNAFWKDEEIVWFDQEWILENTPAKFVLFRAIIQLYGSYSELQEIMPVAVLAERYALAAIWKELYNVENLFVGAVIDQVHLLELRGFQGSVSTDSLQNIKELAHK